MAGHLTDDAREVARAIEAGSELKIKGRALLDAIGPLERAAVIDIGSRAWLVVLPGHGPLSDPQDFLHLADEMA